MIVNCVCSAQLQGHGRTLKDLFLFADKVYNQRRPTMAVFKRSGSTIMVFTSMKCRIMGMPSISTSNPSLLLLDQVIEAQKSILASWSQEKFIQMNVVNFTITTSTMTHKLPKEINFYHYQNFLYFDLEIFCGAKFLFDTSGVGGIEFDGHVNVFSSGQVVVTGVKRQDTFDEILHLLYKKLVYK